MIHQHPPVGHSATIAQTVTFPAPGPYRLVVDVYPAEHPAAGEHELPALRHGARLGRLPAQAAAADLELGPGRRLHASPSRRRHLKAIQATLVVVNVSGPGGKPVGFTPWFGALAHAIFFRKGSLDYFHTHVCAPGVSGCTSVLGPTKVTGSSTTPGKLNVGVLVPAPGTWRLFLQCKLGGKVLTAPFTLEVRS